MILRSGKNKEAPDNCDCDKEDTVCEQAPPMSDPPSQQDAMGPDEKEPSVPGRFKIRKMIFEWPRDQTDVPDKDARAKPVIPPPIILPANQNQKPVNKTLVDHLKATLKATLPNVSYSIKLGTHATTINLTDLDTHRKAEAILTNENYHYYTYPTPENSIKKRKFVIHGLGDVDEDELLDDLRKYGLTPLEVKRMTIKNPRYQGHTNFLVYFNAIDKLTLPLVQRAKHLCHTVVKWSHYQEPTDRATQCGTCWRYGHIGIGCHLPQTCMFCAKTHKSSDCPLLANKIESNSSSIPKELLKCANCKGQHTSINKLCPSRQQFIEKRIARAPPHPPPVAPTKAASKYVNAPQPQENPWVLPVRPVLPAPPTPHPQMRAPSTPHHPPKAPTGPKLPENPPTSINRTKVTYNNQSSENANDIDNCIDDVLFSPQELMKIFHEIVSSISQCRNKNEQLTALFEIAMKHTPCLA